ncbi:transmembrane protease serine 9-like [Hylaeus anthracinus]|uniref:transmembrane protease serine 9-like n=1 Tax=Hylaeus anthracinus TaxID=313031 RepID=UPI0023BA2B13|nr:transmembrane protease serine 9-like [Hylaeus anthracinus]
MQCKLLVFLWICCCAHALPRLVPQNNVKNLPSSNVQVHYNITNSQINNLRPIEETSYIDFIPTPSFPSKRPNVCDNCVCGVGRKIRIVGGNVASVYEYPWMVSMSKQGTFYCAGSLITRRHVLTAAHCMAGFDRRGIKLVLADSNRPNLNKDAVVRRIKSVTIHENFHAYTYNNDIAIIEMDRPVDVNGIVRTACLPEDKAIDYTGATATVVGWGRTGEDEPVSDELRKVNLPILSQEECDESGYQKNRITENMFCAGYLDGKLDACFGDSGGPLHVKGTYGHLEVVGIISWGRGCARPNLPGIYTKLTNYLGWLKDHLDGECVCPPPRSYVVEVTAADKTSVEVFRRMSTVDQNMTLGSTPRKNWILAAILLLLVHVRSMDVRFLKDDSLASTNYTWTNSTQNRKGKFLFDELFGFDISTDSDADDEAVRNCTCECGVSNQEDRIVGGRPTTPNKYPWVARLVYDGRFHCGASLINNDYVLTAAHCVRRLKRSKMRVVLGDYDQHVTTDGRAVMRAVSAVIRHRNFDMNSYNHDVALLRLRKSVKFSKSIKPVCLPQKGTDPAGKEGTVVGWGRTSEGGMLAGIVNEVQVPILSLSQCRMMKYRANRITDNMLCAGRGSQDSCQGDSGGPLLVHEGDRLEIVGIVSWGVGCGRPGYPGVYTRVTRYLKWININMKQGCICSH